jgi:hypothetical protein
LGRNGLLVMKMDMVLRAMRMIFLRIAKIIITKQMLKVNGIMVLPKEVMKMDGMMMWMIM